MFGEREDQEAAMLALIQSSDCDAYHTSTGVTFTTETNTGAQSVKALHAMIDKALVKNLGFKLE